MKVQTTVITTMLGAGSALAIGAFAWARTRRERRLKLLQESFTRQNHAIHAIPHVNDVEEIEVEDRTPRELTKFRAFVYAEFKSVRPALKFTAANHALAMREIAAIIREEKPDMRGTHLAEHVRVILACVFTPSDEELALHALLTAEPTLIERICRWVPFYTPELTVAERTRALTYQA